MGKAPRDKGLPISGRNARRDQAPETAPDRQKERARKRERPGRREAAERRARERSLERLRECESELEAERLEVETAARASLESADPDAAAAGLSAFMARCTERALARATELAAEG